MVPEIIKKSWRTVAEITQLYTLFGWVVPAGAFTAMTALLASYAALPWHLVIFYSSGVFCFTVLATYGLLGLRLRYDDLKQRFNPQDKIKIMPLRWFRTNEGDDPKLLTEMQLGIKVENLATFPLMYRVTQMRTTFDNIHHPRNDFPWKEQKIDSLEYWDVRDAVIYLNPLKPMQYYEGQLDYTIEYWRLGRSRIFTKTESISMEFQFDTPEANYIWRVL